MIYALARPPLLHILAASSRTLIRWTSRQPIRPIPLLALWRRHILGLSFSGAAATAAADAAAEDGEEYQPADAGSEPNDEGPVVIDPGFDFGADVGAFAHSLHIESAYAETKEREGIWMSRSGVLGQD